MRMLTVDDLPEMLARLRRPHQDSYLAMYSSLYYGIVRDAALMVLPLDDHMVHRGDGVFEAMKCVDGAIYNLPAHLERLAQSAGAIALPLPATIDAIARLLVETTRAGGEPDAVVRIFVSRGPGSFSANPYECPEPGLYIVITRLGAPFMQKHPEGARLCTSAIPAKPPFFACIKDCNYLPNVLMQKESVDRQVDFVVSLDARGCVAEGPTENVGIVTRDRALVFPDPGGILRGTTMVRVAELARALVDAGELRSVEFRDIPAAEAHGAAEVLIVGTTRDVIAVREFDSRPVGDGRPGPLWKRLHERLQDDIRRNPAMRTPVFAKYSS